MEVLYILVREAAKKNKNYFTLGNLSKYGHITLKFVGRYFILVVTMGGKALMARPLRE